MSSQEVKNAEINAEIEDHDEENITEDFLATVLQILNITIIRKLQRSWDKSNPIDSMVSGGKAINVALDNEYKVKTVDWDINVWSKDHTQDKTNSAHLEFRDKFGREVTNDLREAIKRNYWRLEPIESHYSTKIIDVTYEINNKEFTSFYGDKYTIGHVNLIDERFGNNGLIDLVALPHITDYLTIDYVKFSDLTTVVQTLKDLITIPGHKKVEKNKKRLETIEKAIATDNLSCNYYRLFENKKQLEHCAKMTIMGPADPIVSSGLRPMPRYKVSKTDIQTHAKYIESLSPSDKAVINEYVDNSFPMSVQLYNFLLYGKTPELLSEIEKLQKIILRSPKTTEDMIVYKATRYLFLKNGKECCFKDGDLMTQPIFNSTSMDNQMPKFGLFTDDFSNCCLYVIYIPKGSNVLIIGDKFDHPEEQEVLLPVGANFVLQDKSDAYSLTSIVEQSIFYDQKMTYLVKYQEPNPHIKAFPGFDKVDVNFKGVSTDEAMNSKQGQDFFSKVYNDLVSTLH